MTMGLLLIAKIASLFFKSSLSTVLPELDPKLRELKK